VISANSQAVDTTLGVSRRPPGTTAWGPDMVDRIPHSTEPARRTTSPVPRITGSVTRVSDAVARTTGPVPPVMNSVTRMKGKVLRRTSADSYETHQVSRSAHLT
jgi:hypothetical protein